MIQPRLHELLALERRLVLRVLTEIAQLDRQIDRAQERRLISPREADRLERKVDQLQDLHARYARNGLTRAEERILDQRINTVKRQIASEVADRDRAPQGRPGDHRR